MARDLPYFRWFTARAKADEKYTSMPDRELGFFHRCLNHAWDNDGLPADLDALARAMRCPRRYLDSVWKIVGKCWYKDGDRLRNKTQEEERSHATRKSLQATDAIRTRYGRVSSDDTDVHTDVATDVLRTGEVFVTPRAYDSDSNSSSQSLKKEKPPPLARGNNGQTSQRFEEWWALWSERRGTNHRPQACQAYLSVVTVTLEADCLDCTRSYVAGPGARDPISGYNPDTFLFEQAKDGFKARWPAAAKSAAEKRRQTVKELYGDD